MRENCRARQPPLSRIQRWGEAFAEAEKDANAATNENDRQMILLDSVSASSLNSMHEGMNYLAKPTGPQERWIRHGSFQSVLIWILAVGVVVIGGACSKQTSKSPEAIKPAGIKMERAGRLQNGAEWRATATVGDAASSARNLAATIDGRPVVVPPVAFDGLPAWNDSLVIQFAESGADVFLMLADGRGPSGWLAKFLIRENRAVERELTIADGEPVLMRFSTGEQVVHGTIPREELEKHRQEHSSPQPKTQPTKL